MSLTNSPYVTIGIRREDGDIDVVACLNNEQGYLNSTAFKMVVEAILMNVRDSEIFERQDVPDVIDMGYEHQERDEEGSVDKRHIHLNMVNKDADVG